MISPSLLLLPGTLQLTPLDKYLSIFFCFLPLGYTPIRGIAKSIVVCVFLGLSFHIAKLLSRKKAINTPPTINENAPFPHMHSNWL